MKVYADLSYYMSIRFISGIQRVVKEVTSRLMHKDGVEVVLLERAEQEMKFCVLCSSDFTRDGLPVRAPHAEEKEKTIVGLCDLEPGSVWLDIDSVWPMHPRRSVLYPLLHRRGVLVVPFLQDVLPITHPEYFAGKGDWVFFAYFYACMTYADLILTSAEATGEEIRKLIHASSGKETPVRAVQLGGNLQAKNYDVSNVDGDAVTFVSSHPFYALMVGTIEPRKNHQTVLQAFEKGLFDEGVGLVFAGRYGWSAEQLISKIRKLQKSEKNFIFLEGKNNDTIRYLYEHAGVVLFPSLEEGYGLPIVEAMTSGVPVIAADRPVLREVGGTLCRYCKARDPEEWRRAIQEVYRDPSAYSAWKEQVKRYHPITWDEVTDKVAECLNDLVLQTAGSQGRISGGDTDG